MYSLFVGIDVSKDSFSVAGLNEKAQVLFSAAPAMNAEGFTQFLKVLTSHCRDLGMVVIALESTGPYHLNLHSFLVSKGIMTMVVNPLIIANFNKLSLRRTKTDKKDALTIARYLFLNRDVLRTMSSSQATTDLKGSGQGEGVSLKNGRFNEKRHQKNPSDHLPRIGTTR